MAMEWSSASSTDEDYYWLLLSKWLPEGDSVLNPSVSVDTIPGDTAPLVPVGPAEIDSGLREMLVSPGVKLLDPGPRVQVKLRGGTKGLTYTTRISWEDSQGRRVTRVATLFIEW